jgi:hypothetical protein
MVGCFTLVSRPNVAGHQMVQDVILTASTKAFTLMCETLFSLGIPVRSDPDWREYEAVFPGSAAVFFGAHEREIVQGPGLSKF